MTNLIIAVFVVGMLASSYAGYYLTAKHYRAELDAIRMEAEMQELIYQRVAEELEHQLTVVKGNFDDLAKQADEVARHPVYSNMCLDPDGLRLVNKALAAGRTP